MNSIILFHLLITEITAIVGAITGSVSLAIVIVQTIKDRPKIDCELGSRAYWYYPTENDNFTNFGVEIKINNKGGRNTTIYSCNLLIKNNGREYNLPSSTYAFQMPQDSTTIQNFTFGLSKRDGLLEGDPMDSIITIKHTYGEKRIEIKHIVKIN